MFNPVKKLETSLSTTCEQKKELKKTNNLITTYLPIQKELKISPSKESDILTPMISFKSFLANLKSYAINSSPPPSLIFKYAFSR